MRVDDREEGQHCCRHRVLISNNCLLQQGQFPLLTNFETQNCPSLTVLHCNCSIMIQIVNDKNS